MHSETIKKIGRVDLVEGEEGFFFVHMEVITRGNVRKMIRIPHCAADGLRVDLDCIMGAMEPQARKLSWESCMTWWRGLGR
ncbi:hypothetical protein ACWCXC_15680 [Streptomyces sp. NPDC001515]